jgi:ribosomal protein L23
LLPVLVMHARESNHDFLYHVSLNTETTMKKIKDNNALLFMVDLKANKKKINAVK